MDDGNPPLLAKYNLLGCPRGLPTIHSATSARRCKTLNDSFATQLVDILIRFVDGIARFTARSPAFPRGLARCGKRGTAARKNSGGDRNIQWAFSGHRKRAPETSGTLLISILAYASPPPLPVPPPPRNFQNQPMSDLLLALPTKNS